MALLEADVNYIEVVKDFVKNALRPPSAASGRKPKAA